MSGRSSTPPNPHTGGGSSPPMSRPPPLLNRWATTREAVPLGGTTGFSPPAAATGAVLTSPIAGLAGGNTPTKSAVVMHHFSKMSEGARGALASAYASSCPANPPVRGGGGGDGGGPKADGAAVRGLGSARGKPEDQSQPSWDFAAGEDSELQQIAGGILSPHTSKHNLHPVGVGKVAMAGGAVATAAATTAAEANVGAAAYVNGAGGEGAATARTAAPKVTVAAAAAVVAAVRPRKSPLQGDDGAGASQAVPPAVRQTQSPNGNGRVRTSPYQIGGVFTSAGAQTDFSTGVHVVCRQRQPSPTNSVFFASPHSIPHNGGGWCAPLQQQQRHPYGFRREAVPAGGGDEPFGSASAAAAAAGNSGVAVPVPGQHAHRDPQGGEGSEEGGALSAYGELHRVPHQQQRQQSSSDGGATLFIPVSRGGVASHCPPHGGSRVAVGPAAGRGHAQVTTTAAAAAKAANSNSGSGAYPTTAVNQQQYPGKPWESTTAAAKAPQQPNSHEAPFASAGGGGGGTARRTSASDSPAPALLTVARPFSERERLAVLAEVQREEQHLYYPCIHIPKENLNNGDTETNARRLEQRRKQIMYGKDTEGYRTYTKVVPHVSLREFHNPLHPITPRPENDCSKRAFDKHLNAWRRQLHLWDSCNVAALGPEFQPLGVATLGDLGLAERLITPVPRPSSTTGLPVHQHHRHMHPASSTMQSIASLTTPGTTEQRGVSAGGAGPMPGPRGGGGGGVGGGAIASCGSFRMESTAAGNNHGMTTPFNRASSGGGRPSSTTDCPTPNITFCVQQMGSGAAPPRSIVNSTGGNHSSTANGGAGGVGGGQGPVGIPSGRTLMPTASTPCRPQSADGPEVDSNFFNAMGNGLAGEGTANGSHRGSRMSSPLGASMPPLDGGKQQSSYSFCSPYQQPYNGGGGGGGGGGSSSSPLARATPFGGNGRTPAHHRPSSATLADRTPTGIAFRPTPFVGGSGGAHVMNRLLDSNFDLMADSTRASPAVPFHNCSGGNGYGGGCYGLMPIPQGSPYRRMDSNGYGFSSSGAGAGLIPSTVVAPLPPPQPHPQRQPPLQPQPQQPQPQPQQQQQQPASSPPATSRDVPAKEGVKRLHTAATAAPSPKGGSSGQPTSHATPPNAGAPQQQPYETRNEAAEVPAAASGECSGGHPPEVLLTAADTQ